MSAPSATSRPTSANASRRLCHCGAGIQLDGAVVVDGPVRSQHAAVPMVGVLVEAKVGHEDELVADLVAEVTQGDLHDAVGVPRFGALGVLAGRDAEKDHSG